MKTKHIPAVIMLTAGLITCITAIIKHMDMDRTFLTVLLVVLLSFYVFGCIVKWVLDKTINPEQEAEEETAEDAEGDDETEGEEETENTQEDQKQ